LALLVDIGGGPFVETFGALGAVKLDTLEGGLAFLEAGDFVEV
jgi:hypothetical protein